MFVLMGIMLPIAFCGLFEKDNRYVEDMVRDFINVKFIRPGVGVFKTQNMYRYMKDKIYDKEVLGIVDDGKSSPEAGNKKGFLKKLWK